MFSPKLPRYSRKTSFWLSLSVAGCAATGLFVRPAPAATLNWDPGHTFGTGSGGTGAWDLSAANWANSSTADTPWTDTSATGTDLASFGGNAAGTVTLGSNLSALGLVFTQPGYTVDGTNLLTLGASGIDATATNSGTTTISTPLNVAASQFWQPGTGSTLSITSTVSTTAAGNQVTLYGYMGTTNLSGGTAAAPSTFGSLNVASIVGTTNISGYLNANGGQFDVTNNGTLNWTAVGNLAAGSLFGVGDTLSGTLNVNAGSITTAAAALFIGNGTNAGFNPNGSVGLINVSGGSVNVTSNGAIYIGAGYQGNIDQSTGVLTISGTGLFTTGTTTGEFTLGPNGTTGNAATVGSGTVNLDGGTLATGRSIALGASTAATGTFNFNGGTLQATADNATYMQGLTAANVRNGGAIINTNGFSVTVAQALVHSAVSGDAARDGGLTKLGTGMLTLTGASTYTGTTTVSAGILSLTTGSINASALVQINAGVLTLGNAAALSDTGTLNLASGTTLNLNAVAGTSETIGSLLLANGNYAPTGTYTATTLAGLDAGVAFNSSFGETLTITAVPEPSAWVSGGLLLLGVLVRSRGMHPRRRRG